MIQILGIRKFRDKNGKEHVYDAFLEHNWRATNLPKLLNNLQTHIDQIPESERWNIFYTVAQCGAQKRQFQSQDCLVFDCDGLNVNKIDEYIGPCLQALGVDVEYATAINSGNGLHLIIQLAEPITDINFFKDRENKLQYRAICNKLNLAIAKLNLPGSFDTTVFDAKRIMRLPGTENRKPGKNKKTAKIIFNNLRPLDASITLQSLSGLTSLPELKKGEFIRASVFKEYANPPIEPIKEQCAFIKNMYENGHEMSEPDWYGGLSIVSRCKDGKKHAHEMSKLSPKYDESNADIKIDQALASSGPRTCASIKDLPMAQGHCNNCPLFDSISSPIQIRDPESIRTETTGFHMVSTDTKGNTKRNPCPNDLRKYFEREYNYKTIKGSKTAFKFNGKFYEKVEDPSLECFAHNHYNPPVLSKHAEEFRKLVNTTCETPASWFADSTKNLLNLQNGVLNLDTKQMEEHSPKYGFLYVLPYDYNPEAKADNFVNMIDKVTGGDVEAQKVLLEYMAYIIQNDSCWLQKALMLVGVGSNGKSTVVDVIEALIGEGNFSAFSLGSLRQHHMIIGMQDKLVNISEETHKKAFEDTALFKNLVGGGTLTAREVYKSSMTWKNRTKMIFLCNELPEHSDQTHGFYRRLLIVPFNKTFSKKDPDFDPFIDRKLRRELPGILNLVLEANDRLRLTEEFSDCKAIDDIIEEYKQEQDMVLSWYKERVKFFPGKEKDLGKYTKVHVAYDDFREMMLQENELEFPTKKKFMKRLRSIDPAIKKMSGVKKEINQGEQETHRVIFNFLVGNYLEEENKVDEIIKNMPEKLPEVDKDAEGIDM